MSQVDAKQEVIAATIEAYLSAIEAQPDLYQFVVHQSGAPGMPHILETAARTIATELARVIGDRLRALGLGPGGAEPWAYGMVGMVQSVGDWWILHSRPMSRAALTDYLTTLLWHGRSGIQAAADLPMGLPGPSASGGRHDHGADMTHSDVAIIGAGFGGLGAAIQLKRNGIHDFVGFDQADDLGGTWRDNSYPGCACACPPTCTPTRSR